MNNKRMKIRTTVATIIAIFTLTCIFSLMAHASDATIVIEVSDNLINTAHNLFYTLKGPAEVALSYLIAFGQYLAYWLAQF